MAFIQWMKEREDLGALTNRNVFFSTFWMDHTARHGEKSPIYKHSIILVL